VSSHVHAVRSLDCHGKLLGIVGVSGLLQSGDDQLESLLIMQRIKVLLGVDAKRITVTFLHSSFQRREGRLSELQLLLAGGVSD
jgi:hypothetical protein